MARAIDFFRDNLRFTNAQGLDTEQEKYNLYGGLIELCKQIDNLEYKLQNIETKINQMRR